MEPKKENNKKIKFSIILLTMFIIIGIFTGAVIGNVKNKFEKINKVEINTQDINIDNEVEEKLTEYKNIVLFGVDSRKNELEEGNRSDCIIIASINETTKEIKLVSVYRDTYAYIDGYGLDKINHAYSYGSAQLAISTLNKNLDLNIKEFITVNLDLLAEIVDELGGITINLNEDELIYMNENIQSTAKLINKTSDKLKTTGINELDGVQTVVYSRMRATLGRRL